jgi:uncharacterized protein
LAERVLIDTGPIVAILCREDAEHENCIECLRSLDAELDSCWPVISEAVFLLGGRADRVQSLLRMLATGAIHLASLGTDPEVVAWLGGFYERFGEHKPDLADAALMYLAERNRVKKVFTLDFRDFSIYRTSENRALEVVGPRD